jgi:hypothetical protein
MAAGAYDMYVGAMSGDGLVKETAVAAAVGGGSGSTGAKIKAAHRQLECD